MTDDSNDVAQVFRDLLKGGSVVFVGRIAELGISFLGLAVIARLIGPTDFGAVAIGSTLLSMLSTLSILGLDTGVGRFLPRYESPADRRGVLVSAFQLAVPVTAATGLAVVLGADLLATRAFGDPSIAPILIVFGLALPFAAIVELCVGALQGQKLAAPKVVVEQLSIPFVRVSLAFAVLYVGWGVLGISVAYGTAYVVAAALGLYYLWRHSSLFGSEAYTPIHRDLLTFSAPLVVTIVMNKILGYLDTFLLAAYLPTAEVGIYKVAYPVAMLLFVGIESANFLFMPILSGLESEGRNRELKRVYQVVTKWIFMGTLPLFLVIALFPEMTLRITFGEQYVGGARTLSILAVGFFTTVIVGPNNNALTSIGKTRIIMAINALAALLNLVLNLLLIPRYGIAGAAVATALSYGLMNLLYTVVLYRVVGVHPFTTAMVRPGVVSLGLVLTLQWVTKTFFPVTIPVVVGMFVVFIGLYGVVILRFGGIQEEEVQLVLDVENKFEVDLGPLKDAVKRIM
ncbi:flippase [Haloplanus litoreus]|uniref:Flippase n=1 Tax=Haloplanus litoreus TaxID=767515 RepID=A0ABD5ZYX3_9EURY